MYRTIKKLIYWVVFTAWLILTIFFLFCLCCTIIYLETFHPLIKKTGSILWREMFKANYYDEDNIKEEGLKPDSQNNGGSTDYYKFKPHWTDCQDIIEDRGMNFAQGNIFKAGFCFNIERHNATNYLRELYKIRWFCDREIARVAND